MHGRDQAAPGGGRPRRFDWLLDGHAARDYARVAAAIRYLAEQRPAQPTLAQVARHLALSPYHLQRLFVRWAGVSPKQFLDHLNLEHAKRRLAAGDSVLGAALATGLSGAGRLHDLFVGIEAMTPGDYRRQGSALEIGHAVLATALGPALVLVTPRGLCGLEFLSGDDPDAAAALAAARRAWPLSRLHADPAGVARSVAELEAGRGGLLLRGSRFQLKVWEALLALPEGCVTSYGALAAALGRPRAARALGGALAANAVAVLIPCHRVLRAHGAPGGYRWGLERKLALLGREALRAGAGPPT